MFVQVIEAKVKDVEQALEALRRWQRELAPTATGWLGSTGGITADGRFVGVARFDSEAAARANSERPEQDAWWQELSSAFDGEATFFESSEVDTMGAGGSDDAGFVQLMIGSTTDKARMRQLDKEFEQQGSSMRPDVIGGTTAWNGDRFVSTIYFTSEAEAREGEQRMSEDPVPEAKAAMEEMQAITSDIRFIDLSSPVLLSP
jgi:hypothetical protein